MQCLKIYLFCDGDLHCKDGSDEDIEYCTGTMYRDILYFHMRIHKKKCVSSLSRYFKMMGMTILMESSISHHVKFIFYFCSIFKKTQQHITEKP